MNRLTDPNRGVRRACLLALASCSPLLTACGQDPDPEQPAAAVAPDEQRGFQSHLTAGTEFLRRGQLDEAGAELALCASIRPEDPDLLFHQARLGLARSQDPRSRQEAASLLERALSAEPGSVKTHRLLLELLVEQGNEVRAGQQREAILSAYGPMGQMELATWDRAASGVPGPSLRMPPADQEDPRIEDYRAFREAFRKLRRKGTYAPGEGVPALESLFAKYSDLAAVRMHFAGMLVYAEVRVPYGDGEDLRPMASKLILDLARSHYRQVLDQVDPTSSMGREARHMLSHVAMSLGEYDQAVASIDMLLASPYLRASERNFQLGRKGLARYRQGRFPEAIGWLEQALADAPQGFQHQLPYEWLLYLAHEGAGTPDEERVGAFRFRTGLAMSAEDTHLRFENVASSFGIDKFDGLGPSAWADYDRDGDDDLMVLGANSHGVLFRNDGGVFTDVSRQAGLQGLQSGFSLTFVDYDNDGWPDLYVSRDGWNGALENSLLRNLGNGTFADVTDEAGIGDSGSSFVQQWSDIDRDGDLDLYLANGITGGGDTNVLYRNNGDGTFTDITEAAGLLEPSGSKTIGVVVGDYDDDGWPDIFVSGFMSLNRLYHNKGDGTFEEVAEAAGIAGADDIAKGYVSFFVDYDNDLDLDVLRPALAPWNETLLGLSERFDDLSTTERRALLRSATRLYRNDGDGTFTDVSEQAGFLHPNGSMGVAMADLDNDGFLDVYFGTGDPAMGRLEPDRFYRNNGDGTFSDLTFACGLGSVAKGHGVTFIDIDADGDLEIYVPLGGFVHGDAWHNAFYLNHQTTGNHWLHVDLEGRESNRDALDTKVIVTAGGQSILREKHNSEGFGSSNSPTLEVGLGAATRVDRLEIRWPSGKIQIFDDVPADQRIVVREGEPWRKWLRAGATRGD